MGNEAGSILNRQPIEPPCKLPWQSLKTCEFIGREGHSSTSINNKVYSYGGSGSTHLFELGVFDVDDNAWRQIQCDGSSPGPLCNASLSAVGSKLFLFGGLNRETGWNNNIWVFDADNVRWQMLETVGIRPCPRDKHSAITWNEKIVIFGGFGPATGIYDVDDDDDDDDAIKFTWFHDTFIFDTSTNTWEAPNINGIEKPVPRAAHSATIYDNKMIVFGGKDCKARNQDLYVLDLLTMEWSKYKDAGARPLPTSFHSSVQYGQFMVTFGGRYNDNTHSDELNVLDCESGGWYSPIEGNSPSPRGQSTMTLISDGTLIMFGGSNKFDVLQQCCQEFDTTVYRLDCKLLKKVEVSDLPLSEEKVHRDIPSNSVPSN